MWENNILHKKTVLVGKLFRKTRDFASETRFSGEKEYFASSSSMFIQLIAENILKYCRFNKTTTKKIHQVSKLLNLYRRNTKILFLIWTNKDYISTFVHLRISSV